MATPSRRLDQLPTWDEKGVLNVIVESPRGSAVKLKYEPEIAAMTVSRPLPLGLVFPFELGFVPRTRAEDGDPLDAAVLLDVGTFRRRSHVKDVSDLSARERDEIDRFFIAAVALEDKELALLGWGDARAARDAVEKARFPASRR